MTNTSSVAY